MLQNSIEYGSKFGYAPARDFASFIRTANMASKIFAVDANAENVQTSGQTHLVLNGLHITASGKTDALDISADVQLTIWLTAQSYTTSHMRFVEHQGRLVFYKCILNHTSSALNKPDEDNLREDATWKTYWVRSTQTARQASGDYIPTANSRYYLALMQNATDTLTLVTAGDIALDADVKLVIPNFEPEMFAAIGTLLINSVGFTLGTTSTAGVSTFAQLLGPVFPTGKGIDSN
jgi:hypothetical protein